MTIRNSVFVLFLQFWLALSGLWAVGAQAALPARMADGQPLPSLAPMLAQVTPAVVNIATYTQQVQRQNPLLQDPFFRRFFDIPEQPRSQRRALSAGSGVIVNARKGYVLTNHHVVGSADEIIVTLNDGRTFPAKLVGSDEQVDLAVLQIEPDNLVQIQIADSTTLAVGDFVVAIGNPFGLGQTVTSGIVSALGRSGLGIYGYEDFIQTDASINPGNSGGALVNLRGELVGINSAIIAPAGGNVGIGFAIPTEIASVIMDQLISYGEVRRGSLGVAFQDLTPELAEAFSLNIHQGALIAQVVEDSPADKAGLKPGDIVVAVDGRPIRAGADLRNRIGLKPVGQSMTVEYLREGKARKVEVVIAESPQTTARGKELNAYFEGASLRDYLNPNGEPVAVEVSEVDRRSVAYRLGLRPGDLIVAANRERVRSVDNLRSAIRNSRSILLQVQRGNTSFYLVIR